MSGYIQRILDEGPPAHISGQVQTSPPGNGLRRCHGPPLRTRQPNHTVRVRGDRNGDRPEALSLWRY